MKEQITIIGRRWFQKTYGNTYHTVEVYVNGELVEKSPETYGYDSQYVQTAHEILNKSGHFKGDYGDFSQAQKDHRDKFVISVTDVNREKDL